MMDLYTIVALVLIAALLVIVFLIRSVYVQLVDPYENYGLALWVIILSIFISLTALLIIPIDIYVLNQGSVSTTVLTVSQKTLQQIYFVIFGILLFNAFFLLPFAYFYGEESSKEQNSDFDEDKEPFGRTCGALRYTVFFIAFVVILLLAGLVFKPGRSPIEKGHEIEWVSNLLDIEHDGYSAILFSIACLMLVGYVGLITYTAYGLTGFPFACIRVAPSWRQRRTANENDLSQLRDKRRALQYTTESKLKAEDKQELRRLAIQQCRLKNENYRLSELESSSKWMSSLFLLLLPFRVVLGCIFVCFSITILSTLALTTYYKLNNSSCGYSCGFETSTSIDSWNPMDSALIFASQYFPLDLVVLSLVVLYVFMSSIYSILKWGIRLAFIPIYKIRPKRTMPQALLIMCFLVTHILLALSNMLVMIAPRYTTYGTQTYLPENGSDRIRCYVSGDLTAADGHPYCRMSVITSLFQNIQKATPILSIAYFYANATFLGVLFLSGVYCLILEKPASLLDERDGCDEEESTLLMRLEKKV